MFDTSVTPLQCQSQRYTAKRRTTRAHHDGILVVPLYCRLSSAVYPTCYRSAQMGFNSVAAAANKLHVL